MRIRNFTPCIVLLVFVALFAITPTPANAQDMHVGLAYAPANTIGFGRGIRLDLRGSKTWRFVEAEAGAWRSNQAKYPNGAKGYRWEWDASLRAVLFNSLRLGVRFDQLGYRTDIPHGATWIKNSDIVPWCEIGFAMKDKGRVLLGHSKSEWRIDLRLHLSVLRLSVSNKWSFFATHEWASGGKKDSALGLALKL